MKRFISVLLIFSFVLAPINHAFAEATAGKVVSAEEYQLAAGDVLDIQILNKKELNTKQTVAPDNTISLPLLNRVSVKNHTLTSFQAFLNTEYAKFVQNLQLVVFLTPKPIYIVEQDETGKAVKVSEAKSIEEAQALAQSEFRIKHGDIITIKQQLPIYVVLHDMAKNTWDVKTAKTIAEAKAYAGKDFTKEINYGDTITVEVGKQQDWLDQNWYKVITATSVITGIVLALRK